MKTTKLNFKFLLSVSGGDRNLANQLATFLEELEKLSVPEIQLSLPPLQGLRNLLGYIAQAKPLTIVATGCPDYATQNGRYTFTGLGEGVSILPRLHLAIARPLLELFLRFGVDFTYYLLIADLAEGTDPVVADKFCGGDLSEFLRRCEATRAALEKMVTQGFPAALTTKMRIRTFSQFYGERYNRIQGEFLNLILERLRRDSSFRQAFLATHAGRTDLYRQFLSGFVDNPTADQLEYRTARGIAQYVTHFALLRLEQEAPVVINHRTINLQWVNRADLTRNRKEAELLKQKSRIPIFVIESKIY